MLHDTYPSVVLCRCVAVVWRINPSSPSPCSTLEDSHRVCPGKGVEAHPSSVPNRKVAWIVVQG